ncbi:MAG: hypothetical protein WC889_06940, partial [Myxococcota bacterium]
IPVTGFQFQESVSGTHRFVEKRRDRGEMPFSFRFVADTDKLKEALHPETRDFFRMTIDGTIRMDGVCSAAPFAGTLEISLIRKRQLIYDFEFKGENGTMYRFAGHKDLSLFQPIKSVMTLYGEVANAKTGRVISTSISFLDLRDLPLLLKSLKIKS